MNNQSHNVQKYGTPPYTVVIVHGGPGAPGEMKPVAEELSKTFGVLEPLQSVDTIDDQIEELKTQIEENASQPVILVGYSWGAWLTYLVAAKFPELVRKLILISSGPFEKSYADKIMSTRMTRLSEDEKKKADEIMNVIKNGSNESKILNEFGAIMNKADSFDPINTRVEQNEFQPGIYKTIWDEAEILRSSGDLLEIGKGIHCPVIAIHGGYDPYPADGVKVPLSKVIKGFRFILLENCGHTPWKEREAKDGFFRLLKKELTI